MLLREHLVSKALSQTRKEKGLVWEKYRVFPNQGYQLFYQKYKVLDCSMFQAFTEDKINLDQMMISVFNGV